MNGRTVAETAAAINRAEDFVAETWSVFEAAGLVLEVSPGRWAIADPLVAAALSEEEAKAEAVASR